MNLKERSFLKLLDYTPEEIRYLLDLSKDFKDKKKNNIEHTYLKGKNIVGAAKIDFLESKYKEKQKIKTYNFTKFTNGIINKEHEVRKQKNRFDLRNINFNENPDNPNDMDPIQNNTTDFRYRFTDDDAITNYSDSNNNNE